MKYLSSYGDETWAESLSDTNQMSGFVALHLGVSSSVVYVVQHTCTVNNNKEGKTDFG